MVTICKSLARYLAFVSDLPKTDALRWEERGRVRLTVAAADGAVWSVTVSSGVERFIGRYVRVGGMGLPGCSLRFLPIAEDGSTPGDVPEGLRVPSAYRRREAR